MIAAFSGADFAEEQGSLPCAWPVTPDIVIPAHPPMAVDEVRYVGEAVAVVVARDRYTAADAVEVIEEPRAVVAPCVGGEFPGSRHAELPRTRTRAVRLVHGRMQLGCGPGLALKGKKFGWRV